MKDVHDSEVFKLLDKKNNVRAKSQSILLQYSLNCNSILEDQLKAISRIFKDNLTTKALEAVHSGAILIFLTEDTNKLPTYYPFIRYKQNGVAKIAVDITPYQSHAKDKVTEEISIRIDHKRLYALVVSAYLYLKLFSSPTNTLAPPLAKYLSDIWAKLFCKILVAKVGLGTNKDRYEAFMYFAQKYFLLNILEVPEAVAESMAVTQFKTKTLSPTVISIQEACKARDIAMYNDLITFCDTLFNAEITGLRGMRLKGSNDGMTFDFFMRQWIMTYYTQSALALASAPHFLWMIISANNYAYIFNDSIIEKECTNDFPKIMSLLYSAISM